MLPGLIACCLAVLTELSSFAYAAEPQYARQISSRLNTTGRVLIIPVPLKDNGTELGDVTIRIDTEDAVLISKADLLERLKGNLDAKARDKALRLEEQGGFVSIPALRSAGVGVTFDKGLQELQLDVAADQRAQNEISLASRPQLRPSTALAEAAGIAGYVNILAEVDHQWGGTTGSIGPGGSDGVTSGRLELESAIRLRDTVLENRAVVDGEVDTNLCPTAAHCVYGHTTGLKRQSSRLVYDDPEQRIRYEIGDTEPLGAPLQSTIETLGVSIEKNSHKLAPTESAAPSAQTSLRIDRPSDVDVIVNGAVMQKLHLRPGIYSVRDLPLATGANEIELVITDDTGQKRSQKLNLFAGNNQLAAGQSEWGVTAGLPSYLRDNDRVYDTSGNYMGTSFLRYGLTEQVTGEAHAQADNRTVMAGGGAITQTPWGVLALSGAFSNSISGIGWAGDASWDLINVKSLFSERKGSFRLSGEFRSTDFYRPGEFLSLATGILYPEFNYWLRLASSYTVALDDQVTATLSGRYQFANAAEASFSPYTIKGDRYGADITLSRPLGRLASGSLVLGYSNESFLRDAVAMQNSEKADFRLAVRLNFRPDEQTSVTTSYDSTDRHSTLSAYRSDGNGVGRWDTSVDVQHMGYSDELTANGSLAYYGNRAEVRLSHNSDVEGVGFAKISPTSSTQRSSLQVVTSVAFADGVVGIGPPVRGGAFALVYPHESIAGHEVTVGENDRPRAIADGWGPAVVTDLPAYAPASLPVDVADLPAGYSLGAGAFDLQPKYRQGYALEVGSAYSVSVYGVLEQANGEPVALSTGFARPAGQGQKSVPVFTNAAGKFGAEGLAPGRWIIEVAGEGQPLRFAVDIPKGVDGLYKAGTLRPIEGAPQ